jgi:hypothetical protein
MKIDEIATSTATRLIVMGLSGAGKSTLVSQLAHHKKLHWFSLDNDIDILRKLPPAARSNIEAYVIPDTATFPVAADTMMKVFKYKKGEICNLHGVWNCGVCKKTGAPVTAVDLTNLNPAEDIVVIDTISQLSHSVLSHATKNQPVDYKPERDDWGALRKWTEFFYSEFQGAKFNLICIAHSIEAEMEDGKTKLVPSFGSKDMSTKIAGAFSHIVYCDVVNKRHAAISSSTGSMKVLTKSRTGFEIEKLDEPSLLPIFDDTLVSGGSSGKGNEQVVVQEQKIVAKNDSPANNALSALQKLNLKK